jgi:hypothetical protein
MAKSFHEGNECGQVRSHQAASLDVQGQGSPAWFVAMIAPIFGARMLLDGLGWRQNIDLLGNAFQGSVLSNFAATIGTGIQRMGVKYGNFFG